MRVKTGREGSVETGAILSEDRVYRYVLWRIWDRSKKPCLWIGLNPSTADETEDDPTIRRCMGFARDWGHGGIYMCNIYPYRATDPAELDKATVDILGEPHRNHKLLWRCAAQSDRVVAAWGASHPVDQVTEQMIRMNIEPRQRVQCLGTTKDGHPRHPLYIKKTTRPRPLYD